MLVLAVGLLFVVRQSTERAIYTQVDQEVQHAQNLLHHLVKQKGQPSIVDGKLLFGTWVANDDHSVVDTVLDVTGATATLFQVKDGVPTRVTTNVPKPDGSGRAVGTVLAGPAKEAFDRGQSYAGTVPILGVNYVTRYDPIRDASGKPIGVVYTGVPLTAIQQVRDEIMRGVLLASAFGVILGMVLIFAVTRPVRRAVAHLRRAAQGLARGDVDQSIDVRSKDEIGDLAAAFREMVTYQREISDVASAIAAGDLTQKVEPKGDHDALGTAFAAMVTNLRGIVGQVKSSANGVAKTSEQLGQAATQTSDAVQQVAQAVQSVAAGSYDASSSTQASRESVSELGQAIDGIARGASDQAQQIQAVSATATEMAAGVEQVASNAHSVVAASQRTKVSAEQGARAVRETVDGMADIKQVVGTAAGKVEELGKLGEKIGAVVETIDDIAEQTNLLALNAAIEAARAGEHGRGFAVVADEVRKLAERSQRETKAISALIHDVQTGTRDAVTAMEVGSAKVEDGAMKADQAGRALAEILEAVEATVSQVTQIATAAQKMTGGARSVVETMNGISAVAEESSAATEQMAAQAGQVTASIDSIAAISEQNSAATEEVSASAEEMSAQVEEMTAQADELATTAEQLRALVARFRLDGSATADAETVPVARRRSGDWSAQPQPHPARMTHAS
jgi:methyl-accepting chemotaxis protein